MLSLSQLTNNRSVKHFVTVRDGQGLEHKWHLPNHDEAVYLSIFGMIQGNIVDRIMDNYARRRQLLDGRWIYYAGAKLWHL